MSFSIFIVSENGGQRSHLSEIYPIVVQLTSRVYILGMLDDCVMAELQRGKESTLWVLMCLRDCDCCKSRQE